MAKSEPFKGSSGFGARRKVERSPGKQSLVSGENVSLKRAPRTSKVESMTRDEVLRLPPETDVYVNGHKRARLAIRIDESRIRPKREVPYWAR